MNPSFEAGVPPDLLALSHLIFEQFKGQRSTMFHAHGWEALHGVKNLVAASPSWDFVPFLDSLSGPLARSQDLFFWAVW